MDGEERAYLLRWREEEEKVSIELSDFSRLLLLGRGGEREKKSRCVILPFFPASVGGGLWPSVVVVVTEGGGSQLVFWPCRGLREEGGKQEGGKLC